MTPEITKEELDIVDLIADLDDGDPLPDLAALLDAEEEKDPTSALENTLLSDTDNQGPDAPAELARSDADAGDVPSGQLSGLTLLYDDTLGDDGSGGSAI